MSLFHVSHRSGRSLCSVDFTFFTCFPYLSLLPAGCALIDRLITDPS